MCWPRVCGWKRYEWISGNNKLTGSARVLGPGKIWLHSELNGWSLNCIFNAITGCLGRGGGSGRWLGSAWGWGVGKLSVRRRHRTLAISCRAAASGFPWTSYWKANMRVSINSARFSLRISASIVRSLPLCFSRALRVFLSYYLVEKLGARPKAQLS